MSDSHVAAEQLSRLIDGDLALAERAAVLDHISHCPSCAAEQGRLVEVSAALRSVPAAQWSDEQTAMILARLPSGLPHATTTPLAARANFQSLSCFGKTDSSTRTSTIFIGVSPLSGSSQSSRFA